MQLLPPAPLAHLVPHPVHKVKIWGASPGCEVAVLEVHHGLHLGGLEHVRQLRGVLLHTLHLPVTQLVLAPPQGCILAVEVLNLDVAECVEVPHPGHIQEGHDLPCAPALWHTAEVQAPDAGHIRDGGGPSAGLNFSPAPLLLQPSGPSRPCRAVPCQHAVEPGAVLVVVGGGVEDLWTATATHMPGICLSGGTVLSTCQAYARHGICLQPKRRHIRLQAYGMPGICLQPNVGPLRMQAYAMPGMWHARHMPGLSSKVAWWSSPCLAYAIY